MPTLLQIDQVGLSPGEPGKSRTDGLAGGELVTLTDTGPDAAAEFRVLWTPPGDAGAVSSLAATGDPKVWTFTPAAGRYGTYLVEHVGTGERRAFVVRTPNLGLIIPALGERGDPSASLFAPGTSESVDNNATDYAEADLNALPFAAWWRAMHELIMRIDSGQLKTIGNESSINVDTLGTGSHILLRTQAADILLQAMGAGSSEWGFASVSISAAGDALLLVENATGKIAFQVTDALTNLRMGSDGANATIRFLDADTPVPRQSITGTTTQEQVDSLVAALAALGLVTDDR
jgi:hypothetical protein